MRRWLPAGPRRNAGAGGRSLVRRLAWRIDRPSASALGKASGLGWRWKRGLPRHEAEVSEPGCGEVEPPIPRFRHGGKVLSKRRAAVGDDRAGRSSCPARSGQRPTGASLDALLLLSPRAAHAAARPAALPGRWALEQGPASQPDPLAALFERGARLAMHGERKGGPSSANAAPGRGLRPANRSARAPATPACPRSAPRTGSRC